MRNIDEGKEFVSFRLSVHVSKDNVVAAVAAAARRRRPRFLTLRIRRELGCRIHHRPPFSYQMRST